MGASQNKDEFINLMRMLEYIANKNRDNLIYSKKNDQFYQIYGNMSYTKLVNELNKSFKQCEKKINELLNSSNYTPGSLLNENEIDNVINQLIVWKKMNPNNKYYFEKAHQLFNKIQNKDFQIKESQMAIEQTHNFGNTKKEYSGKSQHQLLINKQQVIQAQELALLNDNFGRALASLECFANRISGDEISNIFNYYDMFNLGNSQDLVELQKKAFLQTQIFDLAYKDYIKKYVAYNTPENINIIEIINLLKNWESYVPNEHKFMYQGMINILISLSNNTFEQKFKSYSEQCKDAKMDPRKIASFAPGVYYYNQQRCDEAKNEFLEEGKLISKLNINQSYKHDKKAEELAKLISTNEKNYKEEEEFKNLK